MAKINLPFNESGMTPIQTTPNYKEQDLNQAYSEVNAAGDQLMERAIKEGEHWQAKNERAQMMAVEAENNASLMKLIPAAMKDLGGIIDETTNKIIAIDVHQFKEELKKKERAYVLDNGIKLQEDYLKFRQQNPGNPKATLEFMNSRINTALSQAPTETAKLDFLSKAYGTKYSALSSAYSEQKRVGKGQRMSKVGQAYQSVLSQVKLNPLEVNKPIEQMNDISKVLAGEGASKKELQDFNYKFKSDVMATQVHTFLNNNDPKTALQALKEPSYKQNIQPAQYKTLEDLSVKMFAETKLANYKGADLRAGIAALRSGAMTPEMNNAKMYADADFMLNLKTLMPASSSIGPDNVGDISNNLVMYWKGQPIVGKDQAAFILDRVKYSNNPYEVAGYAMAMDRIYKESELKLGNVAAQFGDLDDKYTGMALDIARAAKLGNDKASLEKSVEEIRKFYFNKSKDDLKEFNTAIHKFEQGGEINYEDLVKSTFNSWTNRTPLIGEGYTVNDAVVAKDAKEYFRSAYMKTGSLDSAKELTQAALQRDYQVTWANGDKEVMKNPPERYLGSKEKVALEINKSLGEYFNSVGMVYKDNIVTLPDGSKQQVRIQPLNIQQKEPGKVSYLVTDKDGGLIQKADGNFLTFDVKFDQDKFNEEKNRMLRELGFDPNLTDEEILDGSRKEAYNYLYPSTILDHLSGKELPIDKKLERDAQVAKERSKAIDEKATEDLNNKFKPNK